MPIYEYICNTCGERMEFIVLNSKKEQQLICRNCGGDDLMKIISSFSGIKTENSSEDECCGFKNPCSNPKRCCEGK